MQITELDVSIGERKLISESEPDVQRWRELGLY
jgi:hypothetical protein